MTHISLQEKDQAEEDDKFKKLRALQADVRQVQNEIKNERRSIAHFESKLTHAQVCQFIQVLLYCISLPSTDRAGGTIGHTRRHAERQHPPHALRRRAPR